MTHAPPRFPLIAGPTAGGKTALAVAVAQAFTERALAPVEIISADSMLLYRGLDIGTAKPTGAERAGVHHHLIDILAPDQSFSVYQWLERAQSIIRVVRSGGGVPVVVGGTHLYVKALLAGLFEGPPKDDAVRARLEALSSAERRAMLEARDPAAAARIHPNDTRRTIRALEVCELTGTPISEHQRQWDRGPSAEILLVGLEWPSEALNRRINARVRLMVEQGLIDEARRLWQGGTLGVQARESLGYKQLIEHFEGRCSLDEAVERIKIETRRFAKNQRTWLRRLRTIPGSMWIPGARATAHETVQAIVNQCFTTL
ncbi:MAG: tRNA (adenosine(37)-N6)-dimethylallyltransferase MiaA [Phycisphaerales bacterium]|nr:tRNA (adenosine(37)-N6)-dimethylallyltransferase MiaA [Phycisphaerales bacterium]